MKTFLLLLLYFVCSYSQLPESPIKRVTIEIENQITTVALISLEDHKNHRDSLYNEGYFYSGKFIDANRQFWDSLFTTAELKESDSCFQRCITPDPSGRITIIDANRESFTIDYSHCFKQIEQLTSGNKRYCLSFGSKQELFYERINRAARELRESIVVQGELLGKVTK